MFTLYAYNNSMGYQQPLGLSVVMEVSPTHITTINSKDPVGLSCTHNDIDNTMRRLTMQITDKHTSLRK